MIVASVCLFMVYHMRHGEKGSYFEKNRMGNQVERFVLPDVVKTLAFRARYSKIKREILIRRQAGGINGQTAGYRR